MPGPDGSRDQGGSVRGFTDQDVAPVCNRCSSSPCRRVAPLYTLSAMSPIRPSKKAKPAACAALGTARYGHHLLRRLRGSTPQAGGRLRGPDLRRLHAVALC